MTFLQLAQAVGIVSGALLGLIALLKPLLRWLVVKPLQTMIEEKTYPISPNANGGLSLPDVAKATHKIQTAIDRIENRLNDHIEWHIK